MVNKKKVNPFDLWARLYKGLNIEKIATRPRCLDILKCPSRVENTLFYPNGEIKKIEQ
jgi:hypothetical protein